MFKLIREIKSKAGELHFRRWRILETPLFNIYVHRLYKSDSDLDPHNHPWWFFSFILRGSYLERWFNDAERKAGSVLRRTFSLGVCNRHTFHHITLKSPDVLSLVITGPRSKEVWGYWCKIRNKLSFNYGEQGFLDNDEYRNQKRQLETGNAQYE